LKAFEDQEFEQFPVVMLRNAPFVIMVFGHENIIGTPAIRFVFFHGLAVNGMNGAGGSGFVSEPGDDAALLHRYLRTPG
jgi:hypothetical protein